MYLAISSKAKLNTTENMLLKCNSSDDNVSIERKSWRNHHDTVTELPW